MSWREQTFEQRGAELIALRKGRGEECWFFDSEAEATARRRFIEEAFTWVGTPFRDCGDIKGPDGAVDCAMLLVRCAVDTGLVPAFNPRPYSPRWHVHRHEEKFLDMLVKLGAREVDAPRLGDVLVWRFGRTYAHGAILVNREEVVHAYGKSRACVVTRLTDSVLQSVPFRGQALPRPVRYFDVWRGRAAPGAL
jgi:cell wall-associated NlpC family hydrolase